MTTPIAIVGAPSSIGIRPYDEGGHRRLDLAPRALREQGLVARLAARDRGDVTPPPYRDFERRGIRPRNEDDVAAYSRALGERVAAASADGEFVLVLGGDCSIVLGCLLGAQGNGRVGLVYVDAHADFASPEESSTGSAASMCLALAVGRGDTPLARLGGDRPLVRAEDVVLLARRDHEESRYGHDALSASEILDLPHEAVRERGPAGTARAALKRLVGNGVDGFWIHVDADVLDPELLPAVDSPTPGGLGLEELAELVRPLVRHPGAIGLELTIYDPALDPDRSGAARLAGLLVEALDDDAGAVHSDGAIHHTRSHGRT
jgi:arginase